MEIYVLKFSACLAVFWLVYILFLERQTMHRFKRFYLLGAIASALIIPALTITHYIEPVVTDLEVSPVFIPIEASFVEIPQEPTPFLDLATVLWMIYGFGVLLFSLRFVVNLRRMYSRISNHNTITKQSFIYVLLEECCIPHSFFKYLFFDKLKYETNSIPDEVKLHEETHAKQLHSLDIIVIELLQIVFWFHPLIYILKHHIKLNHEFLADQAVLKLGTDTKTYQNILLQFSSNTQDYQLSSAINYSSIKKRFTVMKTQTSKTRIWLSSFLLLPIIAILFYSFSTKEYVEKEPSETTSVLQVKNEGATAKQLTQYNVLAKKYNAQPKAQRVIPANDLRQLETIYRLMSNNEKAESLPFPECNLTSNQEEPIMWILINRKDQLLVDDELGTLESIENKLKKLAKEGKSGRLVSIKYDPETSKEIISKVEALVKANQFKVLSFDISPVMVILINRNDKLLVDDELGTLESIDNRLKKLAKEGESGRVVSIKHDTETSKEIISKVEALVKANKFKVASFDLSKIPPPPPPPAPKNVDGKSGPIEINGATYYFIQENGKTTYFDRYGKIVDINRIPPPPPIPIDATPKQKANMQKAQEAYNNARQEKGETNKDQITGFTEINGEKLYYVSKNGETTYFNRYGNVVKMDNLPPPPPVPESTLDFVIRMAKSDAKFFNEGKSISSDKAIDLLKKNPKLNVNSQKTETNKPLIYITKKPILIDIKGKVGEPINKVSESDLLVVNGKTIKTGELSMTLAEVKNLKLTLPNSKIINFKLKIPGIKTELIKGNTITKTTLENLLSAKTGDYITLFDIKDDKGSKFKPIAIEIID